jgi:hypothetical protein
MLIVGAEDGAELFMPAFVADSGTEGQLGKRLPWCLLLRA